MIFYSYSKRFVVLGASGFLGRSLVQSLLERKIEVLAPGSKELDLSDPRSAGKLSTQYQEGDHVIVLAGLSPYRGDSTDLFDKNIQIANTIWGSINSRVEHLTYVSSDAVYGSQNRYVQDTTGLAPDTSYGLMHFERELIFKKFVRQLAIVRPTMVFGNNDPHQAYGPNRFIQTAINKNKISLYGDGEELRDYIEVMELVRCLIELSIIGFNGTLNLVSGNSVSFLQLAERIAFCCPGTKIEFIERKKGFFHREYKEPNLHKILTWQPKDIMEHIGTYFEIKNAEN